MRNSKGQFKKDFKVPKSWAFKTSLRMKGNKYNLGRKHNEEWKKNISLKLKGRKNGMMSEELKHKLSRIRIERIMNKKIIPWNRGLSGKDYKSHYKDNFTHLINRKNKTYEEIYGKEKAIKMINKKIGKKQSPETIEKRISKMRAEKSHFWKGGITPLNKKLRRCSMYRIWREAVFLKDNFTCQNFNCPYCSNKMGVFLHPHHIKSFSRHPDLRFDINNGITYCKEFHINSKLLHKQILGGIKNV